MFNIKKLFQSNYYVSNLDQFLHEFDQHYPTLSSSQQIECDKYKRIYQLRDNKITVTPQKTLWDKF